MSETEEPQPPSNDSLGNDSLANDSLGNDSLANVETVYRMDWRRQYPQSLRRVWEAISNPDEIGIWMHYTTKLDLRPGGVIHIEFSAQGSLDGIVCELEPLRLLAYTWGDSLVKWELEEAPAGTGLHLAHIGVHPDLVAGLGAGWNSFLDQLEDYLTGKARPGRYRDWKERYEAERNPGSESV